MPSASADQLAVSVSMGDYEARSAQWGDVTVVFETMGAADPAPLFKGLPDDRCQAEHYGYVLDGELVLRYADAEETVTAGQAYYAPPGHVPLVRSSARVVEFTKTTELEATSEVVGKNVANGAQPL